MLSADELKQIGQVVAGQIEPIKERLDAIEENSEITRTATNEPVKWVELNFSHKYPFPVEKEISV